MEEREENISEKSGLIKRVIISTFFASTLLTLSGCKTLPPPLFFPIVPVPEYSGPGIRIVPGPVYNPRPRVYHPPRVYNPPVIQPYHQEIQPPHPRVQPYHQRIQPKHPVYHRPIRQPKPQRPHPNHP